MAGHEVPWVPLTKLIDDHGLIGDPLELLTVAWRKARIEAGDQAMTVADLSLHEGHYGRGMLATAIAQAHYAAANVRVSEPRTT
jgi:hypothetical protein